MVLKICNIQQDSYYHEIIEEIIGKKYKNLYIYSYAVNVILDIRFIITRVSESLTEILFGDSLDKS